MSEGGRKARLTHVSRGGARMAGRVTRRTGVGASMVDVGAKAVTRREAVAEAWVDVGPRIARAIRETGSVRKGGVLETARVAGLLAAKRTAELIPLCHPIGLDAIEVEATLEGTRIRIVARAAAEARTGVEMEALTAAAIAALTAYDMVKSAGKGVSIGPVRLLEKRGGKSGEWRRGGNSTGRKADGESGGSKRGGKSGGRNDGGRSGGRTRGGERGGRSRKEVRHG